MINRRGTYLFVIKICLGLLFFCVLSTSSYARQIALFYDPIYVDINEGNLFAEASNLKASLELLGHEVKVFTDFSSIVGADFDLVIIPELEKIGITQDLSPEEYNQYKNYVEEGGAIIIMGVVSGNEFQGNNAIDFINEIAGINMKVGQPILEGTCIKNKDFPGGEFIAAPDEIDNNNAVVYIQPDFFSTANVLYYNEENSSEAAVAEFNVGKGSLMYFGWGWWNASPVGSQDGGWLSLLDITIETLSCDQPVLFLEDRYEFQLALNGKFGLREDDFADRYLACTDIEMSFFPSIFDCEDLDKDIQVEVRLKDELERVVTQTITILINDIHDVCELQPLQQQLTGSIQTVIGRPLQDVELTLEGEVEQYSSSDENGLISTSISDSDEYYVTLFKEAKLAKEVTTNDLTMLQKHILGFKLFTSPYQYLAADLNGDKKLDIEDMTLMRKLILNHDTVGAIPLNWLWLDKNYSFEGGARNPLEDEWNTVQGSILDMESLQLNLIGIKIGDIDASYSD